MWRRQLPRLCCDLLVWTVHCDGARFLHIAEIDPCSCVLFVYHVRSPTSSCNNGCGVIMDNADMCSAFFCTNPRMTLRDEWVCNTAGTGAAAAAAGASADDAGGACGGADGGPGTHQLGGLRADHPGGDHRGGHSGAAGSAGAPGQRVHQRRRQPPVKLWLPSPPVQVLGSHAAAAAGQAAVNIGNSGSGSICSEHALQASKLIGGAHVLL